MHIFLYDTVAAISKTGQVRKYEFCNATCFIQHTHTRTHTQLSSSNPSRIPRCTPSVWRRLYKIYEQHHCSKVLSQCCTAGRAMSPTLAGSQWSTGLRPHVETGFTGLWPPLSGPLKMQQWGRPHSCHCKPSLMAQHCLTAPDTSLGLWKKKSLWFNLGL